MIHRSHGCGNRTGKLTSFFLRRRAQHPDPSDWRTNGLSTPPQERRMSANRRALYTVVLPPQQSATPRFVGLTTVES
ncbi:unnamed protein product [Linum trigynum]|uniref:Uncharacterized protein n=1 Tax=Linum trigynum TaxID=586398 RepID=A0AAV2CKC1_9ROSI